MAQCRIDLRPEFLTVVDALQAKYPRIRKDLEGFFQRLEEAPTQANKARRYELGHPTYEAYTYNCKSSDLGKGSNRAFRVVAAYDKQQKLLVPIAMFYKGDMAYMSADEVLQATQAIISATAPEQPSEQSRIDVPEIGVVPEPSLPQAHPSA